MHNWQTSLRRQYARRNPELNPLAPEPDEVSAPSSPASFPEDVNEDHPSATQENGVQANSSQSPSSNLDVSRSSESVPVVYNAGVERLSSDSRPSDWLELPMIEKLDTLHLLTEWQFHNDKRFKQIMKDDGDDASWVSSSFTSHSTPNIDVHCLASRTHRL
jgi:hypothetical protein